MVNWTQLVIATDPPPIAVCEATTRAAPLREELQAPRRRIIILLYSKAQKEIDFESWISLSGFCNKQEQ